MRKSYDIRILPPSAEELKKPATLKNCLNAFKASFADELAKLKVELMKGDDKAKAAICGFISQSVDTHIAAYGEICSYKHVFRCSLEGLSNKLEVENDQLDDNELDDNDIGRCEPWLAANDFSVIFFF